jgi:hypothetical protein
VQGLNLYREPNFKVTRSEVGGADNISDEAEMAASLYKDDQQSCALADRQNQAIKGR